MMEPVNDDDDDIDGVGVMPIQEQDQRIHSSVEETNSSPSSPSSLPSLRSLASVVQPTTTQQQREASSSPSPSLARHRAVLENGEDTVNRSTHNDTTLEQDTVQNANTSDSADRLPALDDVVDAESLLPIELSLSDSSSSGWSFFGGSRFAGTGGNNNTNANGRRQQEQQRQRPTNTTAATPSRSTAVTAANTTARITTTVTITAAEPEPSRLNNNQRSSGPRNTFWTRCCRSKLWNALFPTAMLVAWLFYTFAYLFEINQSCDLPLKLYYWLVTIRLILDSFRNPILRVFCQYENDDPGTTRRPALTSLIILCHTVYSLAVFCIGLHNIFRTFARNTCSSTAFFLYYAAVAIVTVELAKIALICTISFTLLGLACAGFDVSRFYTTLLDFRENEESSNQSTGGDTDEAVHEPEVELEPKLRTVAFKDLSSEDPRECCICMVDFCMGEDIVRTECHHVFHRECCAHWLKRSQVCPVCRAPVRMLPVDRPPSPLGDSAATTTTTNV